MSTLGRSSIDPAAPSRRDRDRSWKTRAMLLVLLAITAGGARAQFTIANFGPLYIDFGAINIGVRKSVPVTVKNLTSAPMSFAGGGVDAVGAIAGFSGSAGTCVGTLAPGASCAWMYSLRPKNNLGTELIGSAGISVMADGRWQLFTVQMKGRGTGSLVVMRPQSIDFGEWLIGETATVPVVISNPQDAMVSLAGGGIGGVQNGFATAGGTCAGGLAPGASCQLNYTFTPSQLGMVQNGTSLTTSTAAPSSVSQTYALQFSGTGVNSLNVVSIAPVTIGFGDVKLGSQVSVPLRFSNFSAFNVSYSGGAAGPAPFNSGGVNGAGCGSGMAVPGATCSIAYGFRPMAQGAQSDLTSMTFTRPGGSQSPTFMFFGTGVGQIAQVSPVDIDLGEVAYGTTQSVPVRILNDGDLALSGFAGGGVPFPFSQTNDCSGTLAPGGSCTFVYTFTAGAPSVGAFEANTLIAFTNTDGVQPTHPIRIRATGVDRVFRDGFE